MEGLSVKSLRLPHSCGDESVNFISLPEFKKYQMKVYSSYFSWNFIELPYDFRRLRVIVN